MLMFGQATVSYFIQAITTFVFGPVLANFVTIFELGIARPEGRIAKLYDISTSLAYSVAKTNIFVSLAISIASVIRLLQLPPVSESGFIGTIAILQFEVALGTVLSLITYRNWKNAGVIALGIYSAATYALYMTSLFKGGLPSSQSQILQNLTWFCVIDRDFPVPTIREQPPKERNDSLYWGIYIASWVGSIIVAGLIKHYFGKPIKKAWQALKKAFFLACRFLHIKPRYHFFCALVMALTGLWATGIVYELYLIQVSRQQLKRASGDLYQDSQWGFGQVTAVLAWAPVLHDAVFESVGKSYSELEIPPALTFSQHTGRRQ